MSSNKLPEELKNSFESIDDKFLSESRKRREIDSKNNEKKLELLNSDSFNLNKDLLILIGTIFGSSIALSTGRTVNQYFMLGEIFLLGSILSGLIILNTHIKAKEWDYAFSSKNSLQSFLLLHKGRIEDFERIAIEDLITTYNNILQSNQSGLLFWFLKIIPVDYWPKILNSCFIIGLILILFSLLPLT